MNSVKPGWYTYLHLPDKDNVLAIYVEGLKKYLSSYDGVNNLPAYASGVCFYLACHDGLYKMAVECGVEFDPYTVWDELCDANNPVAKAWDYYLTTSRSYGDVCGHTPKRREMVEALIKSLEAALK